MERNMPVRIVETDPVDDAWLILHQTSDSITKCEEDVFARIGIPPQQYLILMAIKRMNGPVTPTRLANWVDRNLNSIILIIDRMEKDGLIERVRDLKDRRTLRLIITEKGRQKYKKGIKPARQLSEKILSVLSPEELISFAANLRKVREETFIFRDIKDKVLNPDLPE